MKKISFLAIIASLFFVACKKDDTKTVLTDNSFEVKATSSSTWKYFSFEKGDTVTIDNPSTSTDWDIAFQRYRIKTNGGKSGSGLAQVANSYKTGQTGFDALTVVPDTTTFTADDTVKIAVYTGGTSGTYVNYILSPALYSWFSMEYQSTGTLIVPTDKIFIVKTAKGKYAKLWITSYYSAQNVSGYINFKYKYQADGSKNLE